MIRKLLALSMLIAAPAFAQAEDAAHRADRLRTIELNRRAQSAVDRRDHANADIRDSGRHAQENYEHQRALWRKRVADCEAGHWDACQH